MPFIRKVRVLFKTRLIFPGINGPNMYMHNVDNFFFGGGGGASNLLPTDGPYSGFVVT